ncbi:MAG: DUF6531 domain-containing protein [Cryobacterium sp.]|nr:DUF6531 domain-containing protein [Cryobacterium sp.]
MNKRHLLGKFSFVTVFAVVVTAMISAPAVAAPQRGAVSAAAPKVSAGSAEVFVPNPDAAAAPVPTSNPPESAWEPSSDSRPTAAPDMANRAPAGTPVGAPGLGALPYFSFDTTELSVDTIARVNLGNGNLLLTSNDGVLNGPGLGLRNDRFYNGLSSRDGSFGGGWLSSLLADDIGLLVSGSTATFAGPNGFTAQFTLSGTTYTAPAGFNATLVKDATGYTLTYNKTGEKLRFSLSGYLMTDTDRNNQGVTYTYNTSNKVTGAAQSSGRSVSIAYNASGKVDSINDSSGRSVAYTRNSSGQLTGVDGDRESYTYDSTGRLSEARFWGTGGSGNTATMQRVAFTYDSSHRVTAIKRGVATSSSFIATTSYAYAAGQTTVTDANNHASVFTIDSAGRVSAATDALNRSRSQTYTPNSDVATSTDGFANGGTAGNATLTAYDSLNNATSTTLPTGAAAAAGYATGVNCAGTGGTAYQPKCSTDPGGAKKKYDYDTAGNLTAATDTTTGGTGAVTQRYGYHGSGGVSCGGFPGQICTATDGNNQVTTNTYDIDGNRIKVTPPAPQGATTYTYDSLGRVTTVKDGKGAVTSYVYNVRDQLVKSTYADGSSFVIAYWPTGLEAQRVDSVTGSKGKTYNVLGRLLTETGPVASTITYAYDPVGNITSYQDGAGTVTYGYDAANQLTQSIEPGGSCTTGTGSAADSGCIKYQYDANSAETTRTFPGNATVTTTRDNSGRPTRITGKNNAGTTVADVGYSLTAPGSTGPSADRTLIQTRTSYLEPSIPAGAITSYGYDSLKRLTAAVEKNGAATTASWSYAYDNAGNRTQQVRAGNTGATAGTIGYTYNAANWLTATNADTTTWTYDANGAQTRNGITGQTATVNNRGAITGIGTTSYTAFGQGNTEQLTRSNSTSYTTSTLGLAREDLGGGAQRNYTRTGTGDAISTRFGAGSKYYYIQDTLGSVIGLFDKTGAYAGGYSYSPYGEQRATIIAGSATDSNSLRYINGYYDRASGHYKLGARFYDPSTGRFSQYDPSGQETNPYAYAGCNPINAADPTGLVCTPTRLLEYAGVYGGSAAAITAAAAALTGPIDPLLTILGGGIGVVAGILYGLAVDCNDL